MNRREFIKKGSAGAFFIAAGGKAFGVDAHSNRVHLGDDCWTKTGNVLAPLPYCGKSFA